MDPNAVSVILAALAGGATTALNDTTNTAIKDAYSGLKTLIQRKFANKGNKEAETILTYYEKKPKTYIEPLKNVIIEEKLDQDQEVLEAAHQVMLLIQPQAISGQFNVSNSGTIQGMVQGNYGLINQNFGEIPQEK